jgi:hypothetical protein
MLQHRRLWSQNLEPLPRLLDARLSPRGSIPGDFKWHSCWKKWHWKRFFCVHRSNPVNHHPTIAPHSSVTAPCGVRQPLPSSAVSYPRSEVRDFISEPVLSTFQSKVNFFFSVVKWIRMDQFRVQRLAVVMKLTNFWVFYQQGNRWSEEQVTAVTVLATGYQLRGDNVKYIRKLFRTFVKILNCFSDILKLVQSCRNETNLGACLRNSRMQPSGRSCVLARTAFPPFLCSRNVCWFT